MASTIYVGVSATDLAQPGTLWRVLVRSAVSLGRLLTPRTWTTDVRRCVERLPASGICFAIGDARIDARQEVAVLDLRIASVLPPPGQVTLADLTRTIDRCLPGAEVMQVAKLSGGELDAGTRERALGAAAEEDARRDQETTIARLLGVLKGGAVVLVVVGVLVLVAYAGVLRKRLAS